MAANRCDFNIDVASPAEWATMYRSLGIQIVPGWLPSEHANWKRPKLPQWGEFHETLVPDALFARWYGPRGEHAGRPNMGLVTGRASRNIFVIDLDIYKSPAAINWWLGTMAEHNNRMELETWEQITGGGGKQKLFQAPADWHAPTNRTPIGVDIRGQGGFAVLAPSLHNRGAEYKWVEGFEPWAIECTMAPDWLLRAVEKLVEEHGGDTNSRSGPAERTASPSEDFDAFGGRKDGREDYMARLVWAAVVNWYRECPIRPGDGESGAQMRAAYEGYERNVRTRLDAPDQSDGLEREGRGLSAFTVKWRYAMARWDNEVSAAAAKRRPSAPAPKPHQNDPNAGREAPASKPEVVGPNPAPPRFPFESVGDLRKLPAARWLVDQWVPENSIGIVYGKWAAGKSFIGFDLTFHMAFGMTDWHGAKLPGVPTEVLVLAREGHQGFVNRVDAFKKHHGLVDDPPHLSFMRAAVSFMRDEEFTALCDAIRAQARPYRLILIDTVARVLPGVDTNEQQAVTLFMERCQILGGITGATAIGVHHQNKSGGMMGSVYFEANADFVYEVERQGDEDGPLTAGEITCKKMKDGEDRWKRSVTYKKIILASIGDEPSSLVVSKIDTCQNNTSKASSKWPDKETCRRVLNAANEAWCAGDPWSTAHQNKTRYAPRIIASMFKVPVKTAEEMILKWIENQVLRTEIRNPHSKQKGLRVVGSID